MFEQSWLRALEAIAAFAVAVEESIDSFVVTVPPAQQKQPELQPFAAVEVAFAASVEFAAVGVVAVETSATGQPVVVENTEDIAAESSFASVELAEEIEKEQELHSSSLATLLGLKHVNVESVP